MKIENRGRKAFEIPKGLKPDWHQTNKTVGEQLGCSLLTVMKLRKLFNKPALPRGRPVETITVANRAVRDTLSQIKDMQNSLKDMYKNLRGQTA